MFPRDTCLLVLGLDRGALLLRGVGTNGVLDPPLRGPPILAVKRLLATGRDLRARAGVEDGQREAAGGVLAGDGGVGDDLADEAAGRVVL